MCHFFKHWITERNKIINVWYHLVLIGTGNFGGQMLMLKDSPVGFNTYALNCKYFVPSSSEHIVIWLFSQIRRFLCSWGVSLPRIPLHHMITSCYAEITSTLFLSKPRPRLDNSFKSPNHFVVPETFSQPKYYGNALLFSYDAESN